MSALKKDPIAEAKRYIANADKLLKDNCTVDNLGHYSDNKYVRMAGHTVWSGILIALDPLHPALKKGSRKSVDTYREIFRRDTKYMNVYNSAYNELHLYMGYDGNTHTGIKKAGWESAKTLIDWAEKHLPKAEGADKTTSKKPATKKTATKKTATKKTAK